MERPFKSAGIHVMDFVKNNEVFNKLAAPGYREIARSGAELFDFQDPNDYIGDYYFMRQGRYPIIILNHQSLADIAPANEISDRMNKVGNHHIEFNMPVSISINAKQGSIVRNFYNAAKPWIRQHRIEPYEVARHKDRATHGFEATIETNQELHDTVYTDRGLIIFMEGVQEGGRINPETGKLNGMVEIRNKQVPDQVKASVQEVGREVAFLPVGIDGGYRIFDPKKGMLTTDAIKKISVQKIPFTNPKLATAIVGKPFTSGEMFEDGVSIDDPITINTYLAKRIAALLPEEARGYYA
jgi:hypothetical protein